MESKLSASFKVSQTLIKDIAYIDSFKGKWRGLEINESALLRELKQIATIASIGSSTRIEGSTLTNDEVKALLQNISMSQLKEREEQEVFGYYEVLELILESYQDIELTVNNIHHLHKALLRASGKDEYHRGQFKQITNKVVANYPGGRQKVIFNTTEPPLVASEMDTIVSWTVDCLTSEDYHPLIVIGSFVYEFLSIHPYQDGNGRLSRLLTTLLLLRQGYDFMQYASMETEIEKRKAEYYRVLMSCQKDRYSDEENISEWLVYFLRTLREAIDILEARFAEIRNSKSYFNHRQALIMEHIRNKEPVKMADLTVAFPDESIHTIRKDMAYLRKENSVRKVGQGKSTLYYSIKPRK